MKKWFTFNNGYSLLGIHFENSSLHLGIFPYDEETELYEYGTDKYKLYPKGSWVWGRATEPYDHCLTYYGLGPIMCWVKCNLKPRNKPAK